MRTQEYFEERARRADPGRVSPIFGSRGQGGILLSRATKFHWKFFRRKQKKQANRTRLGATLALEQDWVQLTTPMPIHSRTRSVGRACDI